MPPAGPPPSMQQLLQQAQRMQAQLAAAQAEIAAARLTGSAGGGLVTATVGGSLELGGLTIDPTVVDPGDVETLIDLVLAAVRDAQRQAHELQQDRLAPFQQASGPGVAGL